MLKKKKSKLYKEKDLVCVVLFYPQGLEGWVS